MTRTAGLTVLDNGKTLFRKDIQLGNGPESWSYVGGPIGVHAPREDACTAEVYSMRTSCGVIDGETIGGLRFDEIRLDVGSTVSVPFDPYVEAQGTRIVIGGKGLRHAIGPRGAHRLRFAVNANGYEVFRHNRRSNAVRIAPGLSVPLPTSIVPTPQAMLSLGTQGFLPQHGIHRSYGPIDPGAPSGDGLDFLPGWEGSCELALRRSDGVMARHSVDCLRAADGEPFQNPHAQTYSLSRGYSKSGQLPEFCIPVSADPYDERRLPRWANNNASSYDSWAAGALMYTDPLPHNDEHLRRTNCVLEAAVDQWGDRMAVIDQRSVAWDVAYALELREVQLGNKWMSLIDGLEQQSIEQSGQGHGYLGSRACAWSLDALCTEGADGTGALADRLAKATMRVGMNCGASNRRASPYPFSPSPWLASSGVPDPVGIDRQVFQTMEATIMAFTLARAGYPEVARTWYERLFLDTRRMLVLQDKSILRRHGFIPKFAVCATGNGAPVRRCVEFAGKGDYFGLAAAGLGAFLGGDSTPYIAALNAMGTPYGHVGHTTPGTLAFLRSEGGKEQTAICVAALEQRSA